MPPEPTTSRFKVSVALCTCNGGKFIRQQLESIAHQNHPADEIIICDDASTDSTVREIQAFARAHPEISIRLEINPVRLGVTGNFQKAIVLCTGEIIFLSDQDDWWHSDKITKLLESFADDSVGLAFSNGRVVREDLSPAGYRLWESIWFDAREQEQVRRGNAAPVLLKHAIASGSTMAFRARYLPLILPIPDFPHSHDIWIALLIGCAGRIAIVDEDLIQYRLHASNHVGLRRYNLLGQLRMARWQVETNAFAYAADLHEAAIQRLTAPEQAHWPIAPGILELLQEKVRHSRTRHELPAGWLTRFHVIREELRRGNYRKYSYGYKSVLQDLILR